MSGCTLWGRSPTASGWVRGSHRRWVGLVRGYRSMTGAGCCGQAMLMLAGGGESCTDIESLAAQGRLFGDVCSDTTLYRTFTDSLDGDTLVRARQAIGRIRGEVWERIPAVTGGDDPVILDIDASLVEIHSENKDGTAPNFKGGFGFHPMGLSSFLCEVVVHVVGSRRPGKVMANALSACFHPWVPVPSSPPLLFPMLRIAK